MNDPIKLSRDLAEIVALADDLLAQAVTDAGATVDGHSLPGGHAMVSLAPVADIVTWSARVATTERQWAEDQVRTGAAVLTLDGHIEGLDPTSRPQVGVDDDDTWEPALQTLRFWSDHYRRVRGHDWDSVRTIVTEAKFLRHQLDWILTHEPHADVFARDVRQVRTRLENVLTAGRRADRSSVRCDRPTCDIQPRLIRAYQPRWLTAWSCTSCGHQTPQLVQCDTCDRVWPASETTRCPHTSRRGKVRCEGHTTPITGGHSVCPACHVPAPPYPVWFSDPDRDRWKCPACKHRYDSDDFTRAHTKMLWTEGAERYVTVPDAIATLESQGRGRRTVRRWLAPQLTEIARCTVCRTEWPPDEYPACPKIHEDKRTGETWECGGEITRVWIGDRDAVIHGYCDIATRRAYVWWPDLWSLHTTTRSTPRASA